MSVDFRFDFEFFSPTRVFFGESRLDETGRYIDFADRILVLTSERTARDAVLMNRLFAALKGKHVVLFPGVTRNPKTSMVNQAALLGKKERVQAVLGVGGGSVLDAAKGAAVSIGSGKPVQNFLRDDVPAPDTTLPIIAVPTTAGTGSEVSQGAVLTDDERVVKKGLRGIHLVPRLAVIDPELTYSMPPPITAETGFDILTHAVETLVSKKASALTEIFSLEAVRTVMEYLPRAFQNGLDREARRHLMFASMLMGINLSNSSTCLPHRLQYPVGAHTDSSHPRGLAAIYRAWCDQTYEHATEQFAVLAENISGPKLDGMSVTEKAMTLGHRIDQFLKSINIQHRLRDLGVSVDMCKRLVDEVEGNLSLDPGISSREALLTIYEKSW